jgi:hypothetical protein
LALRDPVPYSLVKNNNFEQQVFYFFFVYMFNLSFLKGQEEVDGSWLKQKVISHNSKLSVENFIAFCAKLKSYQNNDQYNG